MWVTWRLNEFCCIFDVDNFSSSARCICQNQRELVFQPLKFGDFFLEFAKLVWGLDCQTDIVVSPASKTSRWSVTLWRHQLSDTANWKGIAANWDRWQKLPKWPRISFNFYLIVIPKRTISSVNGTNVDLFIWFWKITFFYFGVKFLSCTYYSYKNICQQHAEFVMNMVKVIDQVILFFII